MNRMKVATCLLLHSAYRSFDDINTLCMNSTYLHGMKALVPEQRDKTEVATRVTTRVTTCLLLHFMYLLYHISIDDNNMICINSNYLEGKRYSRCAFRPLRYRPPISLSNPLTERDPRVILDIGERDRRARLIS